MFEAERKMKLGLFVFVRLLTGLFVCVFPLRKSEATENSVASVIGYYSEKLR